MNKLNLLICIIIIFSISCCKSEKHPLLPPVSGRAGEVTLVLNKAEWDTEIGEEFRSMFSCDYKMLPQHEPIFDIVHITHNSFNNIFKSQRNIIMTVISPRYSKPRIFVQKDLWAKTQLVINLYGEDDNAIISLLTKYENEIITLLDEKERKRIMDVYKKTQDKVIVKKIEKNHKLSLVIPMGYKLDVDSSDFVWLNLEAGGIIQGILIYHYNYEDENTFTYDYLIAKRDKFLKKYVGGTIEGSYMTTEKEFKPIFSEFSLKGKLYVAELRGLWKMEKGISIGGPFVSITALDKKRNRIVTIEGFVFAAGYNKRNLMRQVEAIIYSLDFKDEYTSN